MKRRHRIVGFDIGEVMQTYHILSRWCFINDRFGPDTMLVEAPGQRQPAAPVYALVVDRHAALFRARRRWLSKRALPERGLACRSHHNGRLHSSACDQPIPGVAQLERIVVLRILPAIVDRKSTRLNSSHANISYAVFCL